MTGESLIYKQLLIDLMFIIGNLEQVMLLLCAQKVRISLFQLINR